jgi:hypothetical protein
MNWNLTIDEQQLGLQYIFTIIHAGTASKVGSCHSKLDRILLHISEKRFEVCHNVLGPWSIRAPSTHDGQTPMSIFARIGSRRDHYGFPWTVQEPGKPDGVLPEYELQ